MQGELLLEELTMISAAVQKMQRERDELRTEVAFWKQRTLVEEETVGNLVAEVERLTGFVAEMQPELGKLKTEVERLRALVHESEAENDQWQKKLAEVWAKNKELKERVDRYQAIIDEIADEDDE